MSPLRPWRYPSRLSAAQLPRIHLSLEAAFAAHDYTYVARFAETLPELRGCALILLGNRVGGERLLERHQVNSARACFYRAYGAWCDGDAGGAARWLAEAGRLGGDGVKLARFAELLRRESFRLVLHSDCTRADRLAALVGCPGIEVVLTRQLAGDGPGTLPIGQSLASLVPAGAPIDLVLLDDFKLPPVGLGDLGAPVVVTLHDPEWTFGFLDEVMPEVDLLIGWGSWEIIELGRAFGKMCATDFYCFDGPAVQSRGLAQRFTETDGRTLDLLYTGGITHDFYRDKRQRVVSLARLDARFSVRMMEGFFNEADYAAMTRSARFTIASVRGFNSMASRPFDALTHGVIPIVERESAMPYLFSDRIGCFPTYDFDSAVADVEAHLDNYAALLAGFQQHAAMLEAEMQSLLPDDEGQRAERYLRHLLFLAKVEMEPIAVRRQPPARVSVPFSEPTRLAAFPAQALRMDRHTAPPHWLRSALIRMVTKGDDWLLPVFTVIGEGLAAEPRSLALRYALGLCLRLGGNPTEADACFRQVAGGSLLLLPHDPFPWPLDRLNGLYWIADAQIRQRCSFDLEPLVAEDIVWRSYALGHRADLAIDRALAATASGSANTAILEFAQAASLAEQSLDQFSYNEAVQRLALRAQFGLASNGAEGAAQMFLESFEAALANDYSILHDFAPMAIHLLLNRQQPAAAQAIFDDLRRYLERITLTRSHYVLYPEARPLAEAYNIPHTLLQALSA